MITIYMHTNALNGKSYVGQTAQHLERRIRRGFIGYKGSVALKNAIDKYGVGAFTTQILCYVENIDEANRVESSLIESYNTLAPNGYNLHSGGRNGYFCEETKRKIGKAIKGRKHTESTRKKISEGNKGKTVSDETRNKISKANKGRKLTPEHKRKLSESRKGKTAWNKGKPMLEVTKQKLSESNKGRKLTPEQREKISKVRKDKPVWNKGKKLPSHSEETKQKMRGRTAWNKGKPMSDETKQKLSESNKGKVHTPESKEKNRVAALKQWERQRKEKEER